MERVRRGVSVESVSVMQYPAVRTIRGLSSYDVAGRGDGSVKRSNQAMRRSH